MRASTPIAALARALDAAIDRPVLVIGSAPPAARDLDLLARAPEFGRISDLLEQRGMVRRRSTWADLTTTPPTSVELFGAETWALGRAHPSEDLFAGAEPLPGVAHLVRPAPHVRLILAAHSMLQRRGALSEKARRRAVEAAARGDDVWRDARALARPLRLSGALEMLHRSLQRDAPWTAAQRIAEVARAIAVSPAGTRPAVARVLVPGRLRPQLVSLSGPDGSGKSTQAAQLRETLHALGVPSGGAWVPTTTRPPLPPAVRAFADRWRRPPSGKPAGDVTTTPPRRPSAVPVHVRLAEHLWITSAAVANAAKLWRSVLRSDTPVLVLDRFTLDADVKLSYWYALRRGVDIGLERRIFRAIAPRPDVAVLLSVRPETNHARRADEWSLDAFRDQQDIYARTAAELGAVVVDADRPAEDVARDVAGVVWRRLP